MYYFYPVHSNASRQSTSTTNVYWIASALLKKYTSMNLLVVQIWPTSPIQATSWTSTEMTSCVYGTSLALMGKGTVFTYLTRTCIDWRMIVGIVHAWTISMSHTPLIKPTMCVGIGRTQDHQQNASMVQQLVCTILGYC